MCIVLFQHVRTNAAAPPARSMVAAGAVATGRLVTLQQYLMPRFYFQFAKKNLAERQLKEREREREKKKITAQLINSSTLFFFHFLFLRPRAALCCWREQPRNIISDLCACKNQRAHPLNPQQLLCMLNRQMQPTCHY